MRGIAYRNQPHARLVTKLVHFSLFLAVQQAITVLHRDEFRPAVLLSCELHGRELVRPHAAGTDVAHFVTFDEVM